MQQPLHDQPAPRSRGERKRLKYLSEVEAFDVKGKSQIRGGLVMDRKCTDLLCLAIFTACIAAMVGLSFYGYTRGNIFKLIGGLDGDHFICGGEAGYETYNKLYLTDLGGGVEIRQIFQYGVCVKQCPTKANFQLDCRPTSKVQNCNDPSLQQYAYDTINIAGYCMPKNLDQLPQNYQDTWNQALTNLKASQAGQLINDLQITKNAVFICLGLSLIYSIMYIYMMSRFSNCLAKFSILVIELCIVGAAGVSFYLRSNVTNSSQQRTGYLIAGISMVVVFFLFNMLLCCFWKQLEVAIAVIDATADFFAATKRVAGVSVLYFLVSVIVFLGWIAGIGGVVSLNEINPTYNSPQGKDIVWSKQVTIMCSFMIFGLIWLTFWIQDKTGFICMVGASSYYFSSTKDKEGSASLSSGFHFAYFKHAGSLAFGSLVHTLVSIVRHIVEAASDAAAKGGEANILLRIILCCAQCLIRCFESLVEYINTLAYAYMAVSGDSYCTSAWHGFLLNLKHNAKYNFAVVLANMFVFLGKIFITCLNCATFYLVCRYGYKNIDQVNSIWKPVAMIGISTFVISHIFLSLFDEATLATLHCLAIDMDLHNGKPKYGPPSFHAKIERIYEDNQHKTRQQHAQNYEQLNQQRAGPGTNYANSNQMV